MINLWTEEDIVKFKELYPHTRNVDLAQIFNRPIGSILSKAHKLRLYKTESFMAYHTDKTKFKKGNLTWNKGVKGYMGANVTSFKKGQLPKNHLPIGTESIDSKDGYTKVKIADPNVWELKHRVIWKERFGEIPDKHTVIFVDGDNTNFNLHNLALVHRRDLLFFNRWGKYPTEIMETQKLLYKLKNLIKDADKK